MAIRDNYLKVLSFTYDFTVDGGAVGSIGTGVYIPAQFQVIHGAAHVVTTLTSGGSATIAVGVTGLTAAFIGATAVSSWSPGANLAGVDLPASPVAVDVSSELLVTIAVEDLTAGRFVYTMLGYEIGEVGS